ncbi:hypothetical protein [Zunongwangia sp.]|uniref:hypothetical protein n=1 Tax=Zunongwangia sp. TaxID=1965325 RepID=UPI003AA7D078
MKKYAYIGCLGLIGVITTEFGVIGILPQIATHYEISIDRARLLLRAFALIIALTGPFMTLLASGLDRKKSTVAFYLIICYYRSDFFLFPAILVIDVGQDFTRFFATCLYSNGTFGSGISRQ